MIKHFSCIVITVVMCIFSACTGARLKSAMQPKLIYNQMLSDTSRMKVSYLYYRDCKTFFVTIYLENILLNSFEIKDCPNRFLIDKKNSADKGTRFSYKMVSDTLNNQLKCTDLIFPPQCCNSETIKTFVPINEKEREIFKIIEKLILRGDYKFPFTVAEVDKFIGWVKIEY
jgi:hypothetical protein